MLYISEISVQLFSLMRVWTLACLTSNSCSVVQVVCALVAVCIQLCIH